MMLRAIEILGDLPRDFLGDIASYICELEVLGITLLKLGVMA